MSATEATNVNPYPVYRHSGNPWLGEIPMHWDAPRLKQICDQHALYGANIQSSEYTQTGIRFIRTTDITDEGELRPEGVYIPSGRVPEHVLGDGDILVSRSGTIGRSFQYQSDKHGPCSYAGYLVRFIPGSMTQQRYIYLCTKTTAFQNSAQEMAISSTIDNVNAEKYANITIPLPPPDEQAAIVRYLDDVDQHIRVYVSAKERLIALLEEERQAVIHQAVTRGLDPNVRLKPSGVEWLGDVPEHWETIQLGRIGSFSKGSGGTKDDEVPRGIPCVRYGDLYTTHKHFVDQTRSFISEEKLDQYTPIRRGDVLFPASGETIEEIGKSAVNLIEPPMYCGGDLIIFRPTTPVDPKFSGYLLDSATAQDQKSRMGRGVSIMHIYSNQLKYLWLGLPPKDEQEAIAQHLDEVTNDIDTALESARRQIELMEEYRTRLIADVVTGKIDVRTQRVSLSRQG